MANKPHILILMTDQQRADCLSPAGHPVLRTPNMDRIAAADVRRELDRRIYRWLLDTQINL